MFFDPVLRRCTICKDDAKYCRKSIKIVRYFSCLDEDTLPEGAHESMTTLHFERIHDQPTLQKSYLEKEENYYILNFGSIE